MCHFQDWSLSCSRALSLGTPWYTSMRATTRRRRSGRWSCLVRCRRKGWHNRVRLCCPCCAVLGWLQGETGWWSFLTRCRRKFARKVIACAYGLYAMDWIGESILISVGAQEWNSSVHNVHQNGEQSTWHHFNKWSRTHLTDRWCQQRCYANVEHQH